MKEMCFSLGLQEFEPGVTWLAVSTPLVKCLYLQIFRISVESYLLIKATAKNVNHKTSYVISVLTTASMILHKVYK